MKHKMSLMESVRADLNKLSEMYGSDSSTDLLNALDQIEEHLQAAVQAADELVRSGLTQNVSGPFDGQLQSYFIPSIQNWISSSQQPGSLASLRAMVTDEEYDDDDDLFEDDDEYDDYDNGADEGFFVVIASEDDGVFVGAIVMDGGEFREVAIKGTPPYGWGSSKYMSYMSENDIMHYLKQDYGVVKGPFYDEHEATSYARRMV